MEVIALRGAKGVGKSETLNILYQLMLCNGYSQAPGHFLDLGNRHFLDVLTNNIQVVGIVTLGDYARKLPLHLTSLQLKGCIKTVCACTSGQVGTSNAVMRYTPHSFILKLPPTSNPTMRIENNVVAQHLLTLL